MRNFPAAILILSFAAFAIGQPPASRPGTTQPAKMRIEIKATIDGSDELHLTREGFKWSHKLWDWPSEIAINGKPWDPQETPLLPSDTAGVGFDPADLKSERVTVVSKEGRDTIAVEMVGDEIVVYFCDSPNGSDEYRVVLELGADSAKP